MNGYCLHCGLKLAEACDEYGPINLHAACLNAYNADKAAAAKRPKTSMELQLDRIEGLLMAIRDRYSL